MVVERRGSPQARLVAAHPTQPPVVVGALLAVHVEDLRVREDEEAFVGDGLQDDRGHSPGGETAPALSTARCINRCSAVTESLAGRSSLVSTPIEQRQLTRTPSSPYVMLSHSAKPTATCLVTEYGALPIWVSRPAADGNRVTLVIPLDPPAARPDERACCPPSTRGNSKCSRGSL